VAVGLAFCCEGGHFSCFPAATVRIFGIINGGLIFTFMFFVIPLAALTSLVIVQLTDEGSYQMIFIIGAVMTGLNIILLYFLDDIEMKKTKMYKSYLTQCDDMGSSMSLFASTPELKN